MILYNLKVGVDGMILKGRIRSILDSENVPYSIMEGAYVILGKFKAIDWPLYAVWGNALKVNVKSVDSHTSYLQIDPIISWSPVDNIFKPPKENNIATMNKITTLLCNEVKEKVIEKVFSRFWFGTTWLLALAGLIAWINLIMNLDREDMAFGPWNFLIIALILPGYYCFRDLSSRLIPEYSKKQRWMFFVLFIPVIGAIAYYYKVIKQPRADKI